MDPQATWQEMIDALRSGDYCEAVAMAIDLSTWIERGGFPPIVVPELREAAEEPLSVASEFQRQLALQSCLFVRSLS